MTTSATTVTAKHFSCNATITQSYTTAPLPHGDPPMFCKRDKITFPLSRYLSAQFVRHELSEDENFAPGAYVMHLSKHVSVSFATTSLNTAFRFSSCGPEGVNRCVSRASRASRRVRVARGAHADVP